jgi:hypothetical protein
MTSKLLSAIDDRFRGPRAVRMEPHGNQYWPELARDVRMEPHG